MREIKFRAWHKGQNEMFYPDGSVNVNGYTGLTAREIFERFEDDQLMQFTGLKDKNGMEIYEGDIFRIEEDTDDGTEFIYIVITWVQEWCMFCTLRVEDEYPNYLNNGLKELDEPLFWTYTLEDTNSRKHFLCGNIYETPELLKR